LAGANAYSGAPPMSVELHFNHQPVSAAKGATLFAGAEALGINVPTSCRKQGKCKECIVEVTEGMELLSERAAAEKHLKGSFRLSCCCRIIKDAGVVRCHTMRRGNLRIEHHAFHLPAQPRTWRPDPAVTRDGDRVLLDGQEIARATGPLHGLAMDLGTTTVVLRLLNLETGEVVADASFENPQRFGGSDVMARIHYDTEDGTHLLQRTLVGYLTRAIQEFPVDPQSIYEMVVAGNSTMRDLFFRLDVHSIGQSPFHSVTELDMAEGRRASTSLSATAPDLGLPLHSRARVYGLPIISGHVGADAAACLLAVDLANEERLVAIMDIGTNTELIVGNKHKILAASCPAGPAFEGGKISCGMPALPGAIEKVALQPDGTFAVQVIGGGPAEGICGSGLVDLLGELLRTNRMSARGRFDKPGERIVVAAAGDEPVYLTAGDVNELAQAKGANVAGLYIVFDQYGIRPEALDVFYLAGGFGRNLNLDSSKRIGLIPNLPDAKIRQVGNAAIAGACLALLSRAKRAELEALVKRVVHCRLEAHPRFFDCFVEGCRFNPFEFSQTP
jgi:uncharacterized 2Fe-2S/4Fe-4S cluster protein (DUF4445 family)